MCGIVFVKRLDRVPAQKQVLKRYSKQQHRGTDGFGYIGRRDNGTISPLQRFQFEHEIRTKLGASALNEVLFHHRYPTSTPNVPEAAHPLLIANKELAYNYYVVHNGVISNDTELKPKHEKLGYTYTTEVKTQFRTRKGHVYTDEVVFNDSEAFAIELARTIEGLQPECYAKGAIAYIAYQVDKASGKITGVYFGTNGGNQLTMQLDAKFICIASEGGKRIADNKSFCLNPDTNEILEVNVKLQPFYTQTTMGYQRNLYSDSYLDTSEYSGKRGAQVKDIIGEYIHTTDESMSLAELEEALADLDDDIIGTNGDMTYAITEGDEENALGYSEDYQALMARRTKLQSLYERKANQSA